MSSPKLDSKEEKSEGTQSPVETSKVSPETTWTAVWDERAQAYYWWNTETNETTWINPDTPAVQTTAVETTVEKSNPLDFLLDRIDTEVKRKLDGEVEPAAGTTEQSQYYDQYFDQPETSYASTAHFNARTGRFTTQNDVERLNPENLTIESRAKRQMQFYFDVDTYTEERNQQRSFTEDGRVGKKKQLTRKEVEYFKKMKKEKKSKKAREWLLQ
ncbi:uncharacterized protein EV154DRAFT_494553 [Mucor mucedo]|uniref:uncharacterized protein n=1 Tax=Mucor mucedo TaxID=29922 RepID=UPI00222053F8|nr:uncharacterized protein EV154DRAFT_494553 [Mucor mucedo]KAI7895664.1 hypothetical protein EV154DRAFT_494553 [Mucor mucedo]